VDSIDDFNIIEINVLLSKGKLSLSSGLHKSLTRLAASLAIVAAVSSLAVVSASIALCFSSDSSTPEYILSIIIDRNDDVLYFTLLKLKITICWSGISEEALIDGSCLNALATLEAVTVISTLSVLGSSVPY
jgi:hypothetical protein